MIKGFKLVVGTDELRAHLTSRAEYHRGRAAAYEARKEEFAKAPLESMSNDPVKGLQEAGARHAAKAEVFEFSAKHVPDNETFRLDQTDLASLEFISSSLRGY